MNTVSIYLLLAVTAAFSCCVRSQNHSTHTRDNSDDLNNFVIIETTHGLLLGSTERIQGRNAMIDVDVFWGIPYAKPPVGDLRFKRPQPLDSWDELFAATTPPNTCFQIRGNESILVSSQPPTPMSEDCLYLNIWRPRCPGAEREMATMVWIHGGSFMTGSTADPVYNGATLAAFECVIVASVNYRLGPFGFMLQAYKEIQGNMGLLDVAAALKWVKSNVKFFGGHPGKITIFGQGSGGSMVSLFLLSPLTRDLFNNAIVQSGNPLSKFSVQSLMTALSAAEKLIGRLNCGTRFSPTAPQCLREVSATALAEMYASMARTDPTYFMIPVTERYFMPELPFNMLIGGDVKRCSLLIGTTRNEETFILNKLLPIEYSFSNQNPPYLNDKELFRILSRLLAMSFKQQYINIIIANLTTLYEYKRLQDEFPVYSALLFLKLIIRDFLFACPAMSLAFRYDTVYVYRYDYISESSVLPSWVGVTHGSDVPLTFRTTTTEFPQISSSDAQMSETIMKLWANFARFGNPTPYGTSGPTWTQYSRDLASVVMVFGEDAGRNIESVDRNYCVFWNFMIPNEYHIT